MARQAGPAAPQGTPAAPQVALSQNISQAAPASAPGAPSTPSTEDQPAKGFAPSRMAAANLYRKFAQS
jgi:flagellar protein FliS